MRRFLTIFKQFKAICRMKPTLPGCSKLKRSLLAMKEEKEKQLELTDAKETLAGDDAEDGPEEVSADDDAGEKQGENSADDDAEEGHPEEADDDADEKQGESSA